MSRLQELIQKLCQDGVEYRRLGNEFHRLRGTAITAAKMKEIESASGEVRIFAGGKTAINAKEKDIPGANIIRIPAVLVQSRGVIDVIFYDKPFTFKNEMWAYTTDNVSSVKYLYYVLKNNIGYFRRVASSMGSLPQISLSTTENFEIPLPDPEIQAEIVRILDAFTSYSAELQAELQARKEQYAYYRDQLLTFDEHAKGVEWKKLGEVCLVLRGKRLTKRDLNQNGKIPVYHGGIEPIGFYMKSNRVAHSAMVINVGASAGTTGFCNTDFWSSDGCFCFAHNEYINQKYLFFFLQSIEPFLKSKVRKASIPTLDSKDIKQVIIPIPPIQEQQRIVSILDKFEALVNDLTEGLPAEIAAMQEQYEYYRNKLLSFPKITEA